MSGTIDKEIVDAMEGIKINKAQEDKMEDVHTEADRQKGEEMKAHRERVARLDRSKMGEEYLELVKKEALLKKPHVGQHVHKPGSDGRMPRFHRHDNFPFETLDDPSVEMSMAILGTLLHAPPNTIPDDPFTSDFLNFLFVENKGDCKVLLGHQYEQPQSQYPEWRAFPVLQNFAIVYDVLLANGEDIELTWIELREAALIELADLEIEKVEEEKEKEEKEKEEEEKEDAEKAKLAMPVGKNTKTLGKRKKEEDSGDEDFVPARKRAARKSKKTVL